MEIKTLIVDDDQNAINLLKTHLTSYPFISIAGEVNNGVAAMDFLRGAKVDLLFLDIEMDDINGLELAKHIQTLYTDIMIIFVTGHTGFALAGYEFHPIDFLIKPIDPFRLEKTMRLVQEKGGKVTVRYPERKIGMKIAGGIRIVNVQDILYIEKRGRKIGIVSQNGDSFYSSETMKRLEEIFLPYDFFRVHQSFIVPIQHIKSILPDTFTRSYTIQLNDGTMIPLSRNKYNQLSDILVDKGISIY